MFENMLVSFGIDRLASKTSDLSCEISWRQLQFPRWTVIVKCNETSKLALVWEKADFKEPWKNKILGPQTFRCVYHQYINKSAAHPTTYSLPASLHRESALTLRIIILMARRTICVPTRSIRGLLKTAPWYYVTCINHHNPLWKVNANDYTPYITSTAKPLFLC